MRLTDRTTLSRRQRLLARIHRRYVTTTQMVRIGSVNFEFTRIADPDKVLDEVAAEADRRERISGRREADEHLHLPYWAELWDSAAGIGQFLQSIHGRETFLPSFSASPRPRVSASPFLISVLDLGCGMGLSGTIAAALGAKVLFADIEPPALLFARLNSLPWVDRVRARRLNWKTDRLAEQFGLIIGADILYERQQWEYLEPFCKHHLAPGGTLLLGEPGRQTGDLFIPWIQEHGWELNIFEEKVPTRERPVRIFCLGR
jgi:predicted nicotinamide N-methyase